MFILPVMQTGVQRVAALCRGRGVPEILFFPFAPPEAAQEKREMGHSPIPQSRGFAPRNPAKDVLRAPQKFGMTHNWIDERENSHVTQVASVKSLPEIFRPVKLLVLMTRN